MSGLPLPIEERANDAIEPRIVEPKAVRELFTAPLWLPGQIRDMSGLTPAERQRPKPQFASIHRDDATKERRVAHTGRACAPTVTASRTPR